MASAGELGDDLRRIAADLPAGSFAEALAYVERARARINQTIDGSRQPEAAELAGLLAQLVQAADETHQFTATVRAAIEALADNIGTGGQPADNVPAPPSVVRRQVDAGLLAEIRRSGHKISPERVVRTGRDRSGKPVWLEIGKEDSGQAHLLAPGRVAHFAGQGIAMADIVDVVFAAIAIGRPVGITGTDRPVFALPYRGREIWVAVTVGSNGYIVGANPIHPDTKLKRLP